MFIEVLYKCQTEETHESSEEADGNSCDQR